MKKLIYSIVTIVLFTNLFGQSNDDAQSSVVFDNDQLQVRAIEGKCVNKKEGINKDVIFLSFTNKTSEEINVSFFKELHYNNRCINCNSTSNEHNFNVNIGANESKVGTCDTKNGKALIITRKVNAPGAVSKLTDYKLKDIIISTK